nr:hypothetical protein [Jannaschia sp. Os4]
MAQAQAAAYRAPGAPTLTVYTMISNLSGRGGHSALMVSGSQRVLFDPAGSWYHPTAPERGDVFFGMTPGLVEFYEDYHARPSYHVVKHEIAVDAATAERALQLVQAHGTAGKATCGQSVSGVLRELGFTSVKRAWFPERVMRDVAALPGVRETKRFDDVEDPWSPERGARAQAIALEKAAE